MKLEISKEKTQYLKGIGILFIAIHNFFHLSGFSSGENEFRFSTVPFNHLISNISIGNSIGYLFSYFGHYGVQLFIFLSGYGLTVAYGQRNIEYFSFLKKRLWKLYPAFTIAIIALYLYQCFLLDYNFGLSDLKDFVLRYTLIANFIPGKIFSLSGPYWFYSMVVQLYLLFPFLIYLDKKNKSSLWIVALMAILFTLIFNEYFAAHKLSLYYNFMGNLPVFIFGIIMASRKEIVFKPYIWLIAAILFSLGQFNVYFWYFSQLSFLILILMPVLWIYNKGFQSNFIKFTGSISMYIFAVNGFLRKPWIGMSKSTSNIILVYLYALLFICIVYIVAILIKYLEKQILKWFLKSV
ncbi:MAG: acyltransferase [Flavobacteriales bacterium]|nr:acyltransferase [Flavobacteriales bacterium]